VRLPIPSMMEKDRVVAAVAARRATLAGIACVGVVAYALAWFISASVTDRAEAAAQQHATFIGHLVSGDLDATSVTSFDRPTMSQLERLLDRRLLDDTVVLRRFDGTVLASAGSAPVSLDGSVLPRAFEGRPVSERTMSVDGSDLFGSYVPMELEGDGGTLVAVAEIYQDGAAVTAGFDRLRWSLIPAVVLGLALLYGLLQRVWRAASTSVTEEDVKIYILGSSDAAA
jgi:hypothetical protein